MKNSVLKICLNSIVVLIMSIPIQAQVVIFQENFTPGPTCTDNDCNDCGGVISPTCPVGWGTSHGTPSLGSPTIGCDDHLFMGLNLLPSGQASGEGAFANDVYFKTDKCYIIEMMVARTSFVNLEIWATQGFQHSPDIGGDCGGPLPSPSGDLIDLVNYIPGSPGNNPTWHFVRIPYVPNTEGDQLLLFTSRTVPNANGRVRVDDIVITEYDHDITCIEELTFSIPGLILAPGETTTTNFIEIGYENPTNGPNISNLSIADTDMHSGEIRLLPNTSLSVWNTREVHLYIEPCSEYSPCDPVQPITKPVTEIGVRKAYTEPTKEESSEYSFSNLGISTQTLSTNKDHGMQISNPFSENLRIDFYKPGDAIQIEILDLSGRRVLKQEFDRIDEAINVNTSNLVSGAYVLKVIRKDFLLSQIVIKH